MVVEPGRYRYTLGDFKDEHGHPTDIDRSAQVPMTWDNPEIAQVSDQSADGTTGIVVFSLPAALPDGTPGNPVVNFLWEPDVDRTAGVKALPIPFQVVVESGEATSGGVTLTPEPL